MSSPQSRSEYDTAIPASSITSSFSVVTKTLPGWRSPWTKLSWKSIWTKASMPAMQIFRRSSGYCSGGCVAAHCRMGTPSTNDSTSSSSEQ